MIGYSIVIPTYNQKPTLTKLLASLAEQIKNPKTFEVVIADDCSTDGTDSYVKGMRFPIFMKYLQANENLGRSENRNRGFAKTVGKYVLFLDGDAVPAKGMIDEYMSMWERYPDDVVLGTITHPPEWKQDRLHKYLCTRGRLSAKEVTVIPGRFFTTNNFSIKREIYEELGGFDTSFKGWGGEDTDFGLRLEKINCVLRYNPKAICYHYDQKTTENIAAGFTDFGKDGYIRLMEKYPDAVIFPSGWLFGLPDSKPDLFKKLIGKILSPLQSSLGLAIVKLFTLGGALTLRYFDWLFYSKLAESYKRSR